MSKGPVGLESVKELLTELVLSQKEQSKILNDLRGDMSGLKSWKDNQDNQAQRDYEWRTQYDSRVRDLEQKIQSQKDLGDGIKRVEDGLKDLKTEVSKSVTTHKIDQDKINKKIETELKDVREKALERKFIDKALVYGAAVITGIVLHHYFGH